MVGWRVVSAMVPDLMGQERTALSQCLRVGRHLYLSGQVAWDTEKVPLAVGDAYGQARIVFARLRHLMEAAGGTVDDIVKLTMFTTDMRHQPAIWKARAEVFRDPFPCSTLVAIAALVRPQLLVEIEAVGYIDG